MHEREYEREYTDPKPPSLGTTMVVPAKPWWRSRTLILNAVMVGLLILGQIYDNAAALKLPEQWVTVLTVLMGIGNALLRFRTFQPIDGSSEASGLVIAMTQHDGTAQKIDGPIDY